MLRTVIISLVVALLGSLAMTVAVMVMVEPTRDAGTASPVSSLAGVFSTTREEVESQSARLEAMEKRLAAIERSIESLRARTVPGARAERPPAEAPVAAGGGPGDVPPRPSPEGGLRPPPRPLDRLAHAAATADGIAGTPPASVEEIAREWGLTADERTSMEKTLRAHEENVARLVLGPLPIEDMRRMILAARTGARERAILDRLVAKSSAENAAELMTARERLEKSLTPVLGAKRARELAVRPRVPVIDPVVGAYLGSDL